MEKRGAKEVRIGAYPQSCHSPKETIVLRGWNPGRFEDANIFWRSAPPPDPMPETTAKTHEVLGSRN